MVGSIMSEQPTTEGRCAECGMPCAPGEYHPFAACLMFRECHSSEMVRLNLQAVVDHGRSSPEPAAEPPREFVKELESLINRYGMERGSNTPDFILAIYLDSCLQAFNFAAKSRDAWYGVNPAPGGSPPTKEGEV
jgi:hypothetical protein